VNKKIVRYTKFVALSAFAGAFLGGAALVGCSSDSGTQASPIGDVYNLDSSSSAVDPITGQPIEVPASSAAIDPNTGLPVEQPASSATAIDPNTGLPVEQPASSATAIDPNTGLPVVVPASSAQAIVESSSSGLKEYDDNHAPKESFLPAAGFYSSLTINPPTPQKGGQIKCTFDGSYPTAASESIAAAKQITQNTVIRCSEFVNGTAADTTTQTYFIGENVSMPVVALTVNHHDMFDSTDGLYATGNLTNNNAGGMIGGFDMGGFGATDDNNPKCTEPCKQANFWKDTELPVHVEFFENGSSSKSKDWEIDAGISIIGNYSRYKPKKSVAIKMDNDNYGDKTLKYSLFKTRPEAKKFKSFNLRNNGNRFWTDYFGDAMLTSLMEGTEVDYQRSRQVVVFYNGEYFGIHDMRERLNRSFAETNYGIDAKSINVVKNCSNGDEGYNNGWCPSGTNGASSSEFAQVQTSIANGNFDGENNQSYAQAKEKLNMSSFAQYMIAEMYIHNGDWPGNNVRFWGSASSGQPFKAMIFDVDHGYGFSPGITGFDTESQNMFSWVLGSTTMDNSSNGGNQGSVGGFGGFGGMGGWGMGSNSAIGNMLKSLLKNPDFKRLFINQACILLDSYLTYDKVKAAVSSMLATMPASERSRDEQRWPRNQTSFTWQPEGTQLLQFAQNRTQTFKQEVATYFGLSSEVEVTLNVSGSGSILVDEMALPSANYKGKFFAGNALKLTAVAKNGSVFTGWSDGSTQNPRLLEVNSGTSITAQFK